jgi:TolA-binding protein
MCNQRRELAYIKVRPSHPSGAGSTAAFTMNSLMKQIALVATLSALAAASGVARADSIWIAGSTGAPLKADGIKILRVEGDSLVYVAASGSQTSKPLSQVAQLAADDEPAFNTAEQAYRDGKWPEAVDAYQKTVQTTAKDCVRDRSSIRLVEVAAKTNRFDAAVTAYIALVQKDPTLAAKAKPPLPDPNSKYLDGAVADVNKALESSRLSDAQRSNLLSFELEIYRAKKDTNNVNQTLQQLVKLGAASPADLAMLKLASAHAALDAKDYAKATSEIQQNRKLFTDPANQLDALLTLAQAKDGQDGEKDDANTLKDIALAYMRVVTFGKDVPGQPHVAESLLRVAQIEEKLKEPQVALALYQQISKDYADQPAAADARAGVERLGKGS